MTYIFSAVIIVLSYMLYNSILYNSKLIQEQKELINAWAVSDNKLLKACIDMFIQHNFVGNDLNLIKEAYRNSCLKIAEFEKNTVDTPSKS